MGLSSPGERQVICSPENRVALYYVFLIPWPAIYSIRRSFTVHMPDRRMVAGSSVVGVGLQISKYWHIYIQILIYRTRLGCKYWSASRDWHIVLSITAVKIKQFCNWSLILLGTGLNVFHKYLIHYLLELHYNCWYNYVDFIYGATESQKK